MMKKRYYIGVLGAVLFGLFMASCEIGLGGQVDVSSPTLSVSYPAVDSTIRGRFLLQGNCDDDMGVTSVKVTVTNTDTNKSYGPYYASVSDTSWSLWLNGEGSYNGYEFPDGRYVADVIAYDDADRDSGVSSRSFDIDNTPPICILSSPGIEVMDSATEYGTKFKINATIADDHTVAQMRVKIYETDSEGSSNGKLVADWTEANIPTAGGTSVVLASMGTGSLDARYKEVYDYTAYASKADYNDRYYFCEITLTDNAVPSTGSSSDSSAGGNSTSSFYFYDDVYNAWLSNTSNLESSTIKNLFNKTGTANFTTEPLAVPTYNATTGKIDRENEQLLSGEDAFYYCKNNFAQTRGAFSMNPNASPRYSVVGYGVDFGVNTTYSDTTTITTASDDTTLTISARAGRNGTTFKPRTLTAYAFGPFSQTQVQNADFAETIGKIYADPDNYYTTRDDDNICYDENGTVCGYVLVAEDADEESRLKKHSLESYNYEVKVNPNMSSGEYYVIALSGNDVEDETFSPENDYALRIATAFPAPAISWQTAGTKVRDKDNVEYENEVSRNGYYNHGNLTFAGTYTSQASFEADSGTYRITISDYDGTQDGEEKTGNLELKEYSGSSKVWTFSIDENDEWVADNTERQYTISLSIQNGGGSGTQERTIYIDKIDPVVEISSITPVVQDAGTKVNGAVSIKGVVDETSIEGVTYNIYIDGSETGEYDTDVSLGKMFNPISVDTTSYTDEKPIEVKIKAVDKAGNVGTTTTTVYNNNVPLTISQKSDKPLIAGNNYNKVVSKDNISTTSNDGSDGAEPTGNIFGSGNDKLLGSVTDDDGLDSVIITIFNEDGTQYAGTGITNPFTVSLTRGTTSQAFQYTLPNVDGIYQVQIEATDITYDDAATAFKQYRKTTAEKVFVAVDTGSPTITLNEKSTAYKRSYTTDEVTANANIAKVTSTGTVSDGWKLATDAVKVTLRNSSGADIAINSDGDTSAIITPESDGTWSYSFDTAYLADGSHDGTYTLLFTAYDAAGKTSAVSREVVIDTKAPTVPDASETDTDYKTDGIKVTSNGMKIAGVEWYNSQTIAISVSAGDTLSGVDTVEYVAKDSTNASWSFDTLTDNDWTGLTLRDGYYKGSVTFAGVGEQTFYVRATDVAGNVSEVVTKTVKLDTTAPELEASYYQVGSGTVKAIAGTVYANGTQVLTVYGSYLDAESGVKNLKLAIGTKSISPTLTYSSSEITTTETESADGTKTTTINLPDDFEACSDDNATTIKTWKATFTPEATGKLVVTGTNRVGSETEIKPFTITYDTNKPGVQNITLTDSSSVTHSYQPDASKETYYVNNNNSNTFTIAGIATDDVGVDYVNLKVYFDGAADATIDKEYTTVSTWVFDGLDLSSGTTSASAILTIYDYAGNSTSKTLTINFDTDAPKGLHWADYKNKDIVFRIGEADNDKLSSDATKNESGDAWDDDLDKDVGGKYSAGTFGNSTTIKVRGDFYEAGSGVSMIYYKLFEGTSAPDASQVTAFENAIKDGTTSAADGYFAPLSTKQKRRVVYTYDKNNTKKSAVVESGFNTSITGFTEGNNYLVLVAVDKVGNVAADTMEVYYPNGLAYIKAGDDIETTIKTATNHWNGGTGTDTTASDGLSYFSLNVDTTIPDISSDATDIIYTNLATGDIHVSGMAKDSNETTIAGAGIRSVVVSVNGKDITYTENDYYGYVVLTQDGGYDKYNTKWDVYIHPAVFGDATSGNVSVYATVTDDAGTGNSQKVSVATICVDKEAPVVKLTTPTDADSETDIVEVNGIISLNGTVTDGNTLPENADIQILYSTDSTVEKSEWTAMGELSITGTYSFTAANFKTTSLTDETTYYLCARATDIAGNTGYSEAVTVKVSQDTDRPIVTFTNISLRDTDGELMSKDNYIWLKNTNILYFAVSDDDGVVQKVEWAYENGSFKDLGSITSNKLELNDGMNNVVFRITDSNGTQFSYNAANQLKRVKLSDSSKNLINDKTNATNNTMILYLGVDKTTPITADIKFEYYDSATSEYSANEYISVPTLGGTRTKFMMTLDAADENHVDSVVLEFPYGEDSVESYTAAAFGTDGFTEYTASSRSCYADEYTDAVDNDGKYYTTYQVKDIDVSGITETGTYKAHLVVTDKAGLVKEDTFNVTIDMSGPEIKVSGPSSTSPQSGSILVYGVTDGSKAVYYAVSTSDTIKPGNAVTTWSGTDPDEDDSNNSPISGTINITPEYTEIEDASVSWNINFDGDVTASNHTAAMRQYLVNYGITTTDELNKTDGTEFDTIVNLYIWIKAVDEVGNVSEKAHLIQLDPQGDRPTIEFTYPEEAGATLGGKVKIYGTASDTDGVLVGVDTVWMQMIPRNHNAKVDYKSYGENYGSMTYDEDEKTVSTFSMTEDDLDYMAAAGYDVYNMKTYEVGGTNTKWVAGSSSVANNYSASDYAALTSFTGSSWSESINLGGEFDLTSGANPVALRVYARDLDGKFSVATKKLVFFDADKPVISNLYLKKQTSLISAATASREYKADVYVKDDWYLTGTVEDNDSISTLEFYMADGSVIALITDKVAQSGDFAVDITNNGKTVNFVYKLGTGNGVGHIDFTISAVDGAAATNMSAHTQTEKISINYDNEKPVVANNSDAAGFDIATDVQQSNGFYTFGTKVTEEAVSVNNTYYAQSGYAYTAFYFKREYGTGSDKKTKLYDVLYRRTATDTDTEVAERDITGITVPTLTSATSTTDNTLVSDSGLYWYTKNVTRDSAHLDTLTMADATYVHKNSLLQIGGAMYLVSSVDGNTVVIDGSPEATYTTAYVALADIVDNTTPESAGVDAVIQDNGYYDTVNRDDGDGMIESVDKSGTTWLWEASICSKNISDGPATLCYVTFDKAGNYVENSIAVTVSNNRPRLAGVTIRTDYTGNHECETTFDDYTATAMSLDSATSGITDGKVTGTLLYDPDGTSINKSPKKVPLGTSLKIGENQTIAILRGYTEIEPEIVGGNGKIYYDYSAGSLEGKNNTTPIVNEGTIDYSVDDLTSPIRVQLGDLMQIGDTERTEFKFTFWDSTEGMTPFTDSQKAELSIYFGVNVQAVSTPEVKISPFYWNGVKENSIYDSSNASKSSDLKGHIELEGDWKKSSGYTGATSGTADADPKVSGQIVLEGTAHDDSLIDRLYIRIPVMTGRMDASGIAKINSSGYYLVAKWDDSTSKFVSTTTADNFYATYGFNMEIVSSEVGATGHDVEWKFSWNTEMTNNIAATDVPVTFIAYNKGKASCSTGGTDEAYTSIDGKNRYQKTLTYSGAKNNSPSSTQTTTEEKTDYYKMDIVPYVRGVKTVLSSLNAKNSSVYDRSARGHYSVTTESPAYFYGFNIAGGILSDKDGITAPLGDADSSTYSGYTVYSVDVSNLTSGEMYVTVNSVDSLNNKNNNDGRGVYGYTYTYDESGTLISTTDDTKTALSGLTGDYTTYNNFYNRQPNNSNNNVLTDDLVLDIWQFNNGNTSAKPSVLPKSGKIEQPIMKINPINGQIGFAFVNGPLYFSMPMGTNANATANSHDYWMGSYDFFTSVDLAYDSLGYSYAVAAGGDINSSSADKFQFMTSRWGKANLQQSGSYGNTNSLRLESIGMQGGKEANSGYDNNFDKQRIKSPSFATAVHGSATNVYLAYYDAMTGEIRFKYGSTNSTGRTNFGSFTDYDTSGSPYQYRHATVQLLADTPTQQYVNGDYSATVSVQTTPNYPGEYLSLGVVSAEDSTVDDVAVFVWYDQKNFKLMYMYNNTPTTDRANDTTAAGWSEAIPVFSDDSDMAKAGEYCELAVDKNGGVHIAAYDPTNCDLVYAYLPKDKKGVANATNDFYTCVVDGSGVIGSNLTIDVALDDSGVAVPRIGYYATSCIRPKLAYLYDTDVTSKVTAGSVNDEFTGAWECTIVPTPSTVQMQSNQYNKINVGVWKDANGKLKASTSGTTSQPAQNGGYGSASYGYVYGNGKDYAVLGYAIKVAASSDAIETAQMK